MSKVWDKLKKFFLGVMIVTWSLIGIIVLVYISFPACNYLYNYTKVHFKRPMAEKTVEDFIKNYNDKNFDYIYDNLTNDEFKKITTREENKEELSKSFNKYGKIYTKEGKGNFYYIIGNENYIYGAIFYQRAQKKKYQMDYKFYFPKHNKDKIYRIYGYKAFDASEYLK